MGDGGCKVSMLLSMKSAELLNLEILMRGLGYCKEVGVVWMLVRYVQRPWGVHIYMTGKG
jgi:hypothetical protein